MTIPGIPRKMFRDALKQYRRDVPSVGAVSFEQAQEFLRQDRICRGWMNTDGEKMYFHVIKSITEYPKKSLSSAETEQDLFKSTIIMGIQAGIDLDDLFTD